MSGEYRECVDISRAIALQEYRTAYEATAATLKALKLAEEAEERAEAACRRMKIRPHEMQAYLLAE